MRINLFFLLVFFFSRLVSFSQHGLMIDSLRLALKQKPRFVFKFDSKNSFVDDQRAKIIGFKIGVEFGGKIRFGGGYHELNKTQDNLFVYKEVTNSAGKTITVPSFLRLNYWGYFVEYVFHNTKKWEFSIPLQLGFGNTRNEYTIEGVRYKENKKTAIVYEPSISGQYKVFKWLGIGGEVGYRMMLNRSKELRQSFNSPTYAFPRVVVYFDEVYKMVFPKKVKIED